MLTVVFTNDAGERVETPLEPTKVITVGRGKDQSVRIPHSSVSRSHAEFYEVDGAWCVRDMQSSNHTFLNGEETDLAYVQEGDAVRFGDFEVFLEFVAVAPPRRARPVPVSPDPEHTQSTPRSAISSAVSSAEPLPGRRVRPSSVALPEADPIPARRVRPSAIPEPAPPVSRRARPEPELAPAPVGRRPRPSEVELAPIPPRRVEPEPEPVIPPRRAAPEASRPQIAGIDPAVFRAEQDRANRAEEQLREQTRRTEDALNRVRELEGREARFDEEVRDWEERYDRAREQTDHVQGLLDRSREEIIEHEETIETFEREIAELESSLRQFEASRDQSAELLSDLKSKAVQKDRRIDELQRELDMMEFDLRNARDELESVQNSMNFENTETRKLERELALLREVIHEKENHIKTLQIEIEEREKDIYDLKLGTGVKDLQTAKTEMMEKYFSKDKEANELRDKLQKTEQQLKTLQGELEDAVERVAEAKDFANHPDYKRKERELQRATEDAEQLREELGRAQDKLDDFSPEAKAKLESQNATLQKRLGALEDKVAANDAAAPQRGQTDAELATANRRIVGLDSQLAELQMELTDARRALRDRTVTVPAASAEPLAASEDTAPLKAKVSELEEKIGALSLDLRRAKADVDRYREEAAAATATAQQLQSALTSAREAATPTPAAASFDRDGALDSVDAMMDLYRSWKSNLDVLKTYGDDITVSGNEPKAVADAVDGIGQTLTSIEKDAEDMRAELKALRTAIENS